MDIYEDPKRKVDELMVKVSKRYPDFASIQPLATDVMQSIRKTDRIYSSVEEEFFAVCDLALSMREMENV